MAIGCVSEYTQELKEQLDEAQKGYKSKYFEETWGELFREVMPEVREAIEARCIECLKENVENARNELGKKLDQEGREPTNIEILDRELEPTEEEYQEMYKLSEEVEMKQLEIIDYPAITGIKDIETRVEIKDKELEEMGIKELEEKKIIKKLETIPHIDIETMRGFTKEILEFLPTSKIPFEWRDQATVNMIVGVDKQEPGIQKGTIAVEKVVKPEVLQKTDPKTLERSRNLYLFQNKKGRLVPANEGERKEFQWKLAHGICHINDAMEGRFDARIREHQEEWIKACDVQLKAGVVDKEPGRKETPYSLSEFEPEFHNDPEIVQDGREFRAQHFAAWVTDSTWVPGSPPLCPEMKEFFDKYFSD